MSPYRVPVQGFAILLALWSPPSAPAQAGFDWDHPDGLGVRYLLYERIERVGFEREGQVPEMHTMFRPKSKADWVRIKGTEIPWGMNVYEFRGEDGGFARFLAELDPRRAFREFRIEGESAKDGERSHWEFVDTWRPFVEILERPQPRGPFRYAAVPELGLRFVAERTMDYVDPFTGSDGDNCFARLHPAPGEWLRIAGVPGPVAWMVLVYVFPDMEREGSGSAREDLVASFDIFAEREDPMLKSYAREFEVRGTAVDGPGMPRREWRWTDRRREGRARTAPCYHVVAATYDVNGREVALVGRAPSDAADEVPKVLATLERIVRSLEPWAGRATAPGFAFYNVAASVRAGDREVGIVVHVPYGAAARPDRKLVEIARRMVESLEPQESRRHEARR